MSQKNDYPLSFIDSFFRTFSVKHTTTKVNNSTLRLETKNYKNYFQVVLNSCQLLFKMAKTTYTDVDLKVGSGVNIDPPLLSKRSKPLDESSVTHHATFCDTSLHFMKFSYQQIELTIFLHTKENRRIRQRKQVLSKNRQTLLSSFGDVLFG